MNTAESIFKTETSVSGLVEFFRMIIGDDAEMLDYPSCYSCSLITAE